MMDKKPRKKLLSPDVITMPILARPVFYYDTANGYLVEEWVYAHNGESVGYPPQKHEYIGGHCRCWLQPVTGDKDTDQ